MTFFSCFHAFREKPWFSSEYQPLRVLGRGAAATVWLCRCKSDPTQLVAVKATSTEGAAWQLQMALRECTTLCRFGWSHVNIVHPLKLVVTPNYVSLSSYYAAGGNLWDYCKRHRVSEDRACYFFKQLVSALECMHAGHVAYRDVKLDNMLLTDSVPPRVILADFGTSKAWAGEASHMHTFLGTPGFIGPQVLDSMFNQPAKRTQSTTATAGMDDGSNHSSSSAPASTIPLGPTPSATTTSAVSLPGDCSSSHEQPPQEPQEPLPQQQEQQQGAGGGSLPQLRSYDAAKADIWACGAILHFLLLGCLPYGYSDFGALLPMRDSLLTLWQLEKKSWRVAVQRGPEARRLAKLSPEAQDLLDQLLNPDEEARISLAGVKAHPWLQRQLPPLYQRALDIMDRQQAQLASQRSALAAEGRLLASAVQQLFQVALSAKALQQLAQGPGELVLDLDYGHSMLSGRGSGAYPGRVAPAVERLQQQVQEILTRAGELPPALPASAAAASAAAAAAASALASSSGQAAAAAEAVEEEEEQQPAVVPNGQLLTELSLAAGLGPEDLEAADGGSSSSNSNGGIAGSTHSSSSGKEEQWRFRGKQDEQEWEPLPFCGLIEEDKPSSSQQGFLKQHQQEEEQDGCPSCGAKVAQAAAAATAAVPVPAAGKGRVKLVPESLDSTDFPSTPKLEQEQDLVSRWEGFACSS